MGRSYLVLDIETVPDPELAWDAAVDGFPPAPFHQVVALGVLWLDGDHAFRKLGAFGGEEDAPPDESRVLQEFADFVGERQPTMVTFNGRRFDLPVLANRMLKHGVPFAAYYAGRGGGPDYRYRYSDEGHLDLADVLTDFGASRMPSLDALAQLVGMPGKMDVVQTTFVFLRAELLRGRLTREDYRARAAQLWDALSADRRAAPVLERADRRRALLMP